MKASKDSSMKENLISPDGKKKMVPVMALYGANAAGKSNVLHALLLMREMVCGIYAKPLKGEELPQEPFAFTKDAAESTSFEIIYFYNGIKYASVRPGIHGNTAVLFQNWYVDGGTAEWLGAGCR